LKEFNKTVFIENNKLGLEKLDVLKKFVNEGNEFEPIENREYYDIKVNDRAIKDNKIITSKSETKIEILEKIDSLSQKIRE